MNGARWRIAFLKGKLPGQKFSQGAFSPGKRGTYPPRILQQPLIYAAFRWLCESSKQWGSSPGKTYFSYPQCMGKIRYCASLRFSLFFYVLKFLSLFRVRWKILSDFFHRSVRPKDKSPSPFPSAPVSLFIVLLIRKAEDLSATLINGRDVLVSQYFFKIKCSSVFCFNGKTLLFVRRRFDAI